MAAEPGTGQHLIERARSLCLALPDSVERIAWDEPTFRVHDRIFAMFHHDQQARFGIWCKSHDELRDALVLSDPDHFFIPPYVGHKGWIGIRIDESVDWETCEDLIAESYSSIAAKRPKGKRKIPQ